MGRIVRFRRVEHPGRNDQFHGPQHPLVHWHIFVQQAAQAVEHRRGDDGRIGVQVARVDRSGAAEVEHGPIPLNPNAQLDWRAVVQVVPKAVFARGNPLQAAADAGFGRLLDVLHVPQHHLQPVLVDQPPQVLRPAAIGGHLGGQVGQVVFYAAAGIRAGGEQLPQLAEAFPARVEQLEIANHHPFFAQAVRLRRHRTGADAADFGMVGPGGGEKHQPSRALVVHGCDHRQVRQVGAAAVRVVGQEHIAGADGRVVAQNGLHRLAHRAQVDRDVRRVDHQLPPGGKQRAAIVQALLHVHAACRLPQRDAHLLGDGRKATMEHFQQHRVRLFGGVAGRPALGRRRGATFRGLLQQEIPVGKQLGLPARIHNQRRGALKHDGRSRQKHSRRELLVGEKPRLVPAPLVVEPVKAFRLGRDWFQRADRFRLGSHLAHGFHAQGYHFQRVLGPVVAEQPLVFAVVGSGPISVGRLRQCQPGFQPPVAQVHPPGGFHLLPLHSLPDHFVHGFPGQFLP